MVMVIVAEDVEFLEWLADVLQEGRVLVWSTRVIVLTRIPYSDLTRLLRGHRPPWTFSMMSTVFVNQQQPDGNRFKIYTNLPYSERGGHVALLASWALGAGLFKYSDQPFFGEKFARSIRTPENVEMVGAATVQSPRLGRRHAVSFGNLRLQFEEDSAYGFEFPSQQNNDGSLLEPSSLRKLPKFETQLHSLRLIVWCAASQFGVIAPQFFEEEGMTVTVNSERYISMLHNLLQLRMEEIVEDEGLVDIMCERAVRNFRDRLNVLLLTTAILRTLCSELKDYKWFYGATVNVTALPFAPYWEVLEEEKEGGGVTKRLSGMDYLMLEAIGSSYNFKINVVPTVNWDEVTQRVEERVSFLASVIYAVFPHRMEHYDYSYAFEYAFHAFSMAKPALKPQWQSLYYPLSDLVWLLVLVTLILAPLPLHLFSRANPEGEGESLWEGSAFVSINTVIATLLGQGLSDYLPTRSSYRTLLIFWLLFAFIVGTAYRGNLTASLTLPKYPPRVETLSQLVRSGASVGMPPYGAHFEQFFRDSTSDDFKVMAERIDIVPSSKDGLEKALAENYAYMEARRYLQLLIANKFTRTDGSTGLYIGRQSVFPGLSAWPFPHDAPYKHVFDKKIMNIIEAGLYEKWNRDMVEAARQRGRLQLLSETKKKETAGDSAEEEEEEEEEEDSDVDPLSLTHMQGPLMLLLLGWGASCLAFCVEVLPVVFFRSKKD
ncbi:ionotropic receptor 93a-like [Oratosquilla oratoria]|uniref:ionotropic receptor 93a-like n=1 Tax=Oratosquilla oratoria TaxID=337810 RepID=UPI003F7614B6